MGKYATKKRNGANGRFGAKPGRGRYARKSDKPRTQPASRTRADVVLAQGAASLPRKAFGGFSSPSPDLRVWDAKLPMHLSLPRSVGPYLTVRTTKRMTVDAAVTVFGTFKRPSSSAFTGAFSANWTDVCAVADVNHTLAINGTGNAFFTAMPMSGFGPACTVVPSAFSVQLVNPQAVGVSTGIAYCGVMNTQASINGDTRTWDAYANQFLEFQNPRVLMAGKLALRGVQINSYPLNMGACSEFTQLDQIEGYTGMDQQAPQPTGWAPIVCYIPPPTGGETPLHLEALVTTEWRVRFDLTNPASAGHVHHPLSSDWTWEKLMKGAVAMGNGVVDISDMVASTGQSMGRLMNAARPLAALM